MAADNDRPRVTIIGGGMITRIQLLPSLYYLQAQGVVGDIHVCALNAAPLIELREDQTLAKGFPGCSFTPHPDPASVDASEEFPELYKQVLAEAPGGGIAVVAVPDQFHYLVLKEAIAHDLHICCVKPLVLSHRQAEEIEKLAYQRGLIIGVEYHKRFDYRCLMARQAYRAGRLGEFRLGQAELIECWYYRHSNFQNWCTCESSDMFTYVGCHYVDLVAFITGLKPVSVSVYGIVEAYPNGRDGFLWTDGRVIWENGASLSVANGLGYPDAAPGGNTQGMRFWCRGANDAALLFHSDQYRGVKHSYTESGGGPGETVYAEPNPDYLQLLDLGDRTLTPAGYAHRSVEYIIAACCQARSLSNLPERQKLLKRYDDEGIMATPANSSYNELVIEAARKSILAGGREVCIDYGPTPGVHFREY